MPQMCITAAVFLLWFEPATRGCVQSTAIDPPKTTEVMGMNNQQTATTAPVTYSQPSALELLRSTATVVLNEHVNAYGLCAVCGSAFPCERAVLAEHNLASL